MSSEPQRGVRPDRTGHRFDAQVDIDGLAAAADRLDELAEAAELMGDDDASTRLREQAQVARLRAMRVIDAESGS